MRPTKDFLTLFHVEPSDLENIRLIWEAIKADVSWLFDEFYAWLARRTDAYGRMFADTQFANANRRLVERHWIEFFGAEISDDFIAKRHRLGKIHAQMGVALEPYTEGVAELHNLFEELFRRTQVADFELLASFNKLFRMETCLVIYSYTEETNSMLRAQNEALRQLSTPCSASAQTGAFFAPRRSARFLAGARNDVHRPPQNRRNAGAHLFAGYFGHCRRRYSRRRPSSAARRLDAAHGLPHPHRGHLAHHRRNHRFFGH